MLRCSTESRVFILGRHAMDNRQVDVESSMRGPLGPPRILKFLPLLGVAVAARRWLRFAVSHRLSGDQFLRTSELVFVPKTKDDQGGRNVLAHIHRAATLVPVA